ncbi:unnamed protein product [Paramecium sonneborni]|uniref:Uncharacterized protein n=1 Tax=Paramecium sonneborni TaxID=65129 RepID=A0A8S1RUI8_9CILI|nr:unnamed protein product [Paramecium sonneborni]
MEMIKYGIGVRNNDKMMILNEITHQENLLFMLEYIKENKLVTYLKKQRHQKKFQQTRSLRQNWKIFLIESNNHNLNVETKYYNQIQLQQSKLNQKFKIIYSMNQQNIIYIRRNRQNIRMDSLYKQIIFGKQRINWINQQYNKAQIKWEGATVAVVGLYDKGKTFVLNNLTQSNLPS